MAAPAQVAAVILNLGPHSCKGGATRCHSMGNTKSTFFVQFLIAHIVQDITIATVVSGIVLDTGKIEIHWDQTRTIVFRFPGGKTHEPLEDLLQRHYDETISH